MCGHDRNLEIDHVADWATSHRTVLADLAWLCKACHTAKTRGLLHLDGPPNHRTITWTTTRGTQPTETSTSTGTGGGGGTPASRDGPAPDHPTPPAPDHPTRPTPAQQPPLTGLDPDP